MYALLSNLKQLAMLVSEFTLCVAARLAPLPVVLEGLVHVPSG